MKNILEIAEKTGVTFGVAQKLLNLYLKYLWCLGEIDTPPHCPVDSRILVTVGLPNVRWSKMDKGVYKNIIARIKEVADESGFANMSEWELETFNAWGEENEAAEVLLIKASRV